MSLVATVLDSADLENELGALEWAQKAELRDYCRSPSDLSITWVRLVTTEMAERKEI